MSQVIYCISFDTSNMCKGQQHTCFYLNLLLNLSYTALCLCLRVQQSVSRYVRVFARVFPAIVLPEIPPAVGYCEEKLSPSSQQETSAYRLFD